MKGFLKRNTLRLAGIFLFAAGLLSGLLTGRNLYYADGNVSADKAVERREGQYRFINPLLECEGAENYISTELRPFKYYIEELIKKEIESKKAALIAVYFRDLNNGPWFGINEKELFLPGSLVKVPLMMGLLKKAETDPSILKKEIKYDHDLPPSGQFIRPRRYIEYGNSYTAEELINYMIVYSDNNAAELLRSVEVGDIGQKVSIELGLVPPDVLPSESMNIHRYSSYFRVLFNASYLNKEMSNKALEILGNVDFKDGIVAGVPPDMTVAHKFGERKNREGQKEFHDCGIVYYPDYPYLLCVMTRGYDYRELVPVIRDISRATYEEVDRQMSQTTQ